MAKISKINENFTLIFNSREDSTNDSVMDIEVKFDNPRDDSVIIHRLNTWLVAIGKSSIVVSPVSLPKG